MNDKNQESIVDKFLQIISQIPDRELYILMSRKVGFKSLENIAKVCGITVERTRQIEKEAHKKLASKIKNNLCK